MPIKEEHKIKILNMGYNILNEYQKGSNIWFLDLQDSFGYKIESDVYSVMKGYYRPFGNTNKFTIENIYLWLEKNKKEFILCEGNEFKGSHKKLKFYCNICKENFYMAWDEVRSNQNCSVCSGKQVGERRNFGSMNPELAKEWSSKNDFTPFEYSPMSGKTVIWECINCKYEWKCRISSRVSGTVCPNCRYGTKTFENSFPELLIDWDYDSNGNPSSYSFHSGKKISWKCGICSHIWMATVDHRANGTGCPACNGDIVNDKNSLSVNFPELLDEWNYNKNESPETYFQFSNKSVWWICCKCQHEWKSSITNRTNCHNGCPKCRKSKGEKIIEKFLYKNNFFYISQYRNILCKDKLTLPFDFAIIDEFENPIILIEYHGEQHYKPIIYFGGESKFEDQKEKDKIKLNYCKDNNISLLIIPYWDFNNIEEILTKELNIQSSLSKTLTN